MALVNELEESGPEEREADIDLNSGSCVSRSLRTCAENRSRAGQAGNKAV
jgi:hypothetical protein